jgi:hypothetical protein
MPLQSSGTLRLSQIQTEFGGSNPISLSEYLRGGTLVPNTPNSGKNQSIPNSASSVSMSKYYSTSKTVVVTYELIGGGGGGSGSGAEDGEPSRGTFAGSGSSSSISGGSITTITAAGGQGGENQKFERGSVGTDGQSTTYGPGGSGGALNTRGGNAPSTSYGAGGGGAGGDDGSYSDPGGASGEGGNAGTRRTGSFTVTYGSTISVSIGSGGSGGNSTYDGGRGANGYCVLSYDGITVTFTATGSRVIN